MARKAKSEGPSQSQKIRDFMKEHPQASTAEIARVLKVKPSLIYNIKAMAKKSKKGRKKGVKRGRKVAVSSNGSAGQNSLTAAADLILVAGSVDAARSALNQVEELARKVAGKV